MIDIFKKRIKGFTLSELLITLVVIGVIASITIPVVVAKYNEYDKLAKIRKSYTTLNNALSLSIVSGGDDLFDVSANDFKTVEKYFNSYLKTKFFLISNIGCSFSHF